ncbi:hypothetical protein [Clostridium ganghwense]|uniref:Uncharacterized protein n=1 Tax=Clostridium ganghwense TaxID=312089 RepID=A0ABT4CKF8_9CLOT|nr:hypothetical protein [Clostridium ganghwense]MCY6369534.1 hypothetical protein [Clostridium ganghwense]
MGVVRNFIDILGITPENELPREILGQIIRNSEAEKILVEDNVDIKNIYQIVIKVDIKSNRVIETPLNKLVVIDVLKQIKILYYDKDDRVGVLELKSPYNFFIDIEDKKDEIESIRIYIADAYFQLISKKELYSNIVYIIDVHYYGGKKNTSLDLNGQNCGNNKENYQYKDYITLVNSNETEEKYFNEPVNELVALSDSLSTVNTSFEEKETKEESELIDIDSEYL